MRRGRSDAEPVLVFDRVVKRYRTRGKGSGQVVALDQVSFQVQPGEIFGLVGESGSGKTTAGRLIVSLEKPDGGAVRVAGQDLGRLGHRALRRHSRNVQMIFQDPYQSLNPQMSVLDTVAEPLEIHRLARGAAVEDRVWRVMEEVGLSPPWDYGHRFPHQLSGGQRQRVAIARAVVLEPRFLVADEPTSMLDASISAQIFNILLALRQDLGVSILFITHSLAAARYLCDRIGVIYRGNLMEVGPADAVIRTPLHPYTRALIDALPAFGRDAGQPRYDTLLREERAGSEPKGCAFFSRCKRADPSRCARERPALVGDGDPPHATACFYPEGGEHRLTT